MIEKFSVELEDYGDGKRIFRVIVYLGETYPLAAQQAGFIHDAIVEKIEKFTEPDRIGTKYANHQGDKHASESK